jgi:two-component system sensor histidine kinase RegB
VPRWTVSSLVGWFFVLDTLCLTALLMLSGGPNNPFSLLYLVHITVSATILTQRQTWGLGILSSLCFGALFWCYRPIPALEMHHRGEGVNLHLTGMWVGFSAASMLVAMFSARISELLRRMQEELAKKDRLASLVTLAAGAAHELNTPLGTIAVVAKELERYASTTLPDPAIAEDSRLIRTEVDRCRQILQRMSVEGAEPAGEPLRVVPAMELVRRAMSQFPAERVLAAAADSRKEPALRVPEHAVEQALIALIKNGIEASQGPVRVTVRADGAAVCFSVSDEGTGMSPEAMRHAGEPFFTTKAPGKGMGLGIFLVRTLADRLGGGLVIESQAGRGTTANLELPVHVAHVSQNLEPATR